MDQQPRFQLGQKVKVPVAAFAQHFSSKAEAYFFAANELKCVLPAKETVTAFHIKDIISGAKGYVKGDDLKFLAVPHYESLSLQKILDWTKANYPQVIDRYFPIERELEKFPRQVSQKPSFACIHQFFELIIKNNSSFLYLL